MVTSVIALNAPRRGFSEVDPVEDTERAISDRTWGLEVRLQ